MRLAILKNQCGDPQTVWMHERLAYTNVAAARHNRAVKVIAVGKTIAVFRE